MIPRDTAELDDAERSTFLCIVCGYGASRHRAPERCPMCGGTDWTQKPRRITDPYADFHVITRADSDTSDLDADLPLRRERHRTTRPRSGRPS